MGGLVDGKTGNPNPLLGLVLILFIFAGNANLIPIVVAVSNVHIVYMGKRQHDDPKLVTGSHHQILASVLGSKEAAKESIIYSYKHGFSGFAAKLTESQAQQIAELPGVLRVMPNSFVKRHTTRSWDYLDLPVSSHSNLLHDSNMGDGIIIGVLDTGIWPESKAFSDKGFGPIPSRWKGFCESGEQFNATEHCNKKLIGARSFIKGLLAEHGKYFNRTEFRGVLSPRDTQGHGTHTASTAAGSPVDNVSFRGLAFGTVRGGAPSARLAIYKVLWKNDLQGTSADVLKALDEAIHDGVDVLSLSIGFDIPIFSDFDEIKSIAIGSFHAVLKGITVVSAGGNSGPEAQTVENTSPWMIMVAASTMDRSFPAQITLGNNRTILGSAKYTGHEIGFTNLIYPTAPGPFGILTGLCRALPVLNTTVTGKVVFCFTKVGDAADLADAIKYAIINGADGLIIAQSNDNSLIEVGGFPIIHVDFELGTRILQYIRYSKSPMVKLSPAKTLVAKFISTKVAAFSSRGPSSNSPAILKPDIAAPGVNILAATSPLSDDDPGDKGFAFMSGTSMATPHVSGIVALLKSVHPHWSPAAIRSALATTASTSDDSGGPIYAEGSPRNLANPFDFGGGIVNPNKAAQPGLVYDMGIADYIHYLCAMGYKNSDISKLVEHTTCPSKRPSLLDVNVPSITVPWLRDTVAVTRTVTNVGAINSTYRAIIEAPSGTTVVVKPDVLVFSPTMKMMSFTVTVSTSHRKNTGYYFGSLTWTDGLHSVRSPISVRTQVKAFYVDYN